MTMGWFIAGVVYALVWWTVLFCVLPVGVRPESEGDVAKGGWRGTPSQPRLGRKLLWTTGISFLVWLAIVGVVESGLISFRDDWLAIPDR